MNWLSILMQVLPAVKDGVDTILKDEGMTEEQAVQAVINHLTPGKPNAPALSETATPK